jgi:carboxyl-terminal processing protease
MLRKLLPQNRILRLICLFVLVFDIALFGYNIACKGLYLEWSTDKSLRKHNLPRVACSYVDRFYVDPERILPVEMLKEGLSWMERFVPEVMVDFPPPSDTAIIIVNDKEMSFDFSDVQTLDDAAWILKDAIGFVQANLQDDSIEGDDIEYTATNGMLSQLDPHTVLFPPKDYAEFRIGTSGKFGGLGMVVGIREFTLTVISPIEGTPAYRAGMKPGDKIVEIDGESTVNMTLFDAVSKLRGEPESTVNLSVLREKWAEPKIVPIKREIIAIPSVDSKSLGDGIGYLKIRSFQNDTSWDLNKHLKRLRTDNGRIKGLIIDMRNNSGGLLDQAIEVADKFLSYGNIVMTVGAGKRHKDVSIAQELETDEPYYPIVVIIDAGSASGAEIVAGALKENNRAVLIGDRSFGKGTVQQLIDLVDGSALKITVAKYLTPLGTDIQSVGITPDIELFPVRIEKDDIRLFKGSYHPLRESDLKQHFGEETETETPPETIKYLYKAEEKTPEEKQEDAYKLPDFSNDFAVQFAKKLVSNTSSWNKVEILERSKGLLEETKEANEVEIVNALSDQGIDWGTPKSVQKAAGIPKPTARLTFDKSTVKAGDKVVFTVEVTNEGEAPLYRLWAKTECKNHIFDGLEFIFGKIEKGQSRSYPTTVELPQGAFDREDDITIEFNELNEYTPKETSGTIITEALPRPQFAYSYQILDNGYNGNNDGLIQNGESIELLLHIKNVGEGKSTKNIATLRDVSHKDVFIELGKDEIGELLPGDSKTVTLRFTVKQSLPVNEFNMNIVISDTTFGTFLSDKVTFHVAKSAETVETAKSDKAQETGLSSLRVPPSIKLTQPISSSLLGLGKITLSGIIKDDKYVKHVYILANNDKVFFKLNSPDSKDESRLPFAAEIKLKDGPNTITVVARDDLGLITAKTFVVNSKPAVAKRTD